VPEKLTGLQSLITPGITNKSTVHEAFGEPFLESDEWNIEAFRVARGQDIHLLVGFFIPMWVWLNDAIIYAIVLYDTNNVVEDIAIDTFREDHGSLSLEVGEFRFLIRSPYGPGSKGRGKNRLPHLFSA
jgi:hypothetical protein